MRLLFHAALVIFACLATVASAHAQFVEPRQTLPKIDVKDGDDWIQPFRRSLGNADRARVGANLRQLRNEVNDDILKIRPGFLPRLYWFDIQFDWGNPDLNQSLRYGIVASFEADTPKEQQVSCQTLLDFATNSIAIRKLVFQPSYRDVSLEQVLTSVTNSSRDAACSEIIGAVHSIEWEGEGLPPGFLQPWRDKLDKGLLNFKHCASVQVFAAIGRWNQPVESCTRQHTE